MDFNKKEPENPIPGKDHEERFLAEMLSHITERLKNKYKYSDSELLKVWNQNEVLVPVSIFSGKISPAEALAKFLRENHDMTFVQISKMIGRDERSIWANYKRAAKKMPWPFEVSTDVSVPLSVFTGQKSILESIVSYLKEVKQLRNKKIAQLLNKNSANVWTVYNRSKKKANIHHKNAIN